MGASREQLGSWCRGVESELLLSHLTHLENVLHTLRLRVFCIETQTELRPPGTACLQVQLELLQEQWEVQLISSQREASRLRDRLQQEREEAVKETKSLQEQLHSSHCTQDQDVQAMGDMLRELQAARADTLQRKRELETLWKDHTHLQRSSAAALEASHSHHELLERSIERLRGDLRAIAQGDDTQLQEENEALRTKLRDKEQELHTLRREGEENLSNAKQEIKRLTKLVKAAKHHGRKSAPHEEIQKALDAARCRSHDLSQTNEKLQQRVQDLEELAFNQRARIKAQDVLLKQRL